MRKILLIIIFSSFLYSCKDFRYDIMYLYSSDKTQVVSIFTSLNHSKRIIANGKHNYPPDNNYYLLDITNVERIGDEIGICWKSNKYEWEIVNHESIIKETNIDKNKYVLRTEWFKDDRLLPTPRYYRKDNCFTVVMEKYDTFYIPKENGHVEKFY